MNRTQILVFGGFALAGAIGGWADDRQCRFLGALAGAAVLWAGVAIAAYAAAGADGLARSSSGKGLGNTGVALCVLLGLMWLVITAIAAGDVSGVLGCEW